MRRLLDIATAAYLTAVYDPLQALQEMAEFMLESLLCQIPPLRSYLELCFYASRRTAWNKQATDDPSLLCKFRH
jgi:hypothetical protein